MFRFRPFSFIMFVLMVIGLAIFWSVLQQQFGLGPAPAGSRRADQEAARQAELEKKRVEFVRFEQDRGISLADQASKDIERAINEAGIWQKDFVPLLENFDGRMIAANAPLTEQLFSLFDEPRMSVDDLTKLRTEMEEAVRPIREAKGNNSTDAIEKSVVESLEKMAARASKEAVLWIKANEGATAVLRETKRGNQETSDETLKKAFEKLRDQRALVELQEKQEENKRQQAIQKKKEAMEKAAAEAKAEEEAKLKEEANSDEVRQHLGIFFERRTLQPRGTAGVVKWERVIDSQPTSLERLRNIGALHDSLQGLVILSRIGTRRELPQPRWMFPTEAANWSEENQTFLKKAQEMLNRLGPTLVKEGLLSP
ncbi:hypothetical protein K2X85_08445 [bacterium]|nr:hypothetical protein [bacterium]